MILPSTYPAGLLVLIAAMLCWGSWASVQKSTGRWRFELFYCDFSVGALVCAVAAAYTLGAMRPQELTFQDNLLIASYRKMAYVAGSGMLLNLGNMLLAGAVSVGGMALAFPVGLGLALVIGAVWSSLNSAPIPIPPLVGAVLVLAAVVVNAAAYSKYKDAQNPPEKSRTRRARPTGAAKAIALSIFSGVVLGIAFPLLEVGRAGDDGVGPYGAAMLVAAGVLFSTVLYNPFFLTFPVQGAPAELKNYFRGSKGQHGLGLLGGIVWMAAILCNFVAAAAPAEAQAGPALVSALWQAAAVVATLWGWFAWQEFRGSGGRVKFLLGGMLVLYMAGITVVAAAPLWGK